VNAGLLGKARIAIRTIRVEITDTVRTVGTIGITGAATMSTAHAARTTVFARTGTRHTVGRPLIGSFGIARAASELSVKLAACQTAGSLPRAQLIGIAESVWTVVIDRTRETVVGTTVARRLAIRRSEIEYAQVQAFIARKTLACVVRRAASSCPTWRVEEVFLTCRVFEPPDFDT